MSKVGAPHVFRPDIQGLRALAVLSVIAYHAGVPAFGGGYLGVDVFFVISGYLIGGHIVREILATGRLDFAAFFSRRARRILPASLTVIVLTMLASLVVAPPVRATEIALDALAATLSVANLRFAVDGTDYLAGTTPSPLVHYWSLGVEEQFYLVVPFLLVGLFFFLRQNARMIFASGVVLTATSFVICVLWGTSSSWTYFTLPARAWELGVGVIIAVIGSKASHLAPRWRQLFASVGALTLGASAWLGGLPGFSHPGLGTLLPVVATAIIILAGEQGKHPAPIVTRVLGIGPAQFVGALSFSLYLVHWPLLALARENSSSAEAVPLITLVALAGASVPLAWLLWRFVERPFLRTPDPRAATRQPLLVAGITTAALALALTISVPALAARPLTSNQPAATGVQFLPAGTAQVPSNLQPLLTAATADTGELYRSGCQQSTTASALTVCAFGPADGTTVALVGDSHAGRWFPALAAAFDGRPIRLVTLTKSGCRTIETEKLWGKAVNQSCVAWRASVLNWLEHNPPDLIVLANHLGQSSKSDSASATLWRHATETTVPRFPDEVPVVILAETPEFDFSPPVCLSAHLEDAQSCSELRSVAVNSAAIGGVRLGSATAGATFVDLTDWFCNAQRCPTVIGSTLVYTDEHHLSATFSVQLGDAIYDALSPLLTPAR